MEKPVFSKKEQRVIDYCRNEYEETGYTPNIGDICRGCNTTVKTLLGKTVPSIDKKGWPYNSKIDID